MDAIEKENYRNSISFNGLDLFDEDLFELKAKLSDIDAGDSVRIHFDTSELLLFGKNAEIMKKSAEMYFEALKEYNIPKNWQKKFDVIDYPCKYFKFKLDSNSQEYKDIKSNTETGNIH